MNEDKVDLLAAALLRQVSGRFEDRLLEIDAALTAQRLLIEQMLANSFIGNPEGLDAFIGGLSDRVRRAATAAEPLDSDHKAELQARTAARLLRIGESVRRLVAP